MSRPYTTTSRMTITSIEHRDVVVVVVGRDVVTLYSQYYPINGSSDFIPPPPMQSATVQSYTGSRQTDLTHGRPRGRTSPTAKTVPLLTFPYPSIPCCPIPIQDHSRIRTQVAAHHRAPPSHDNQGAGFGTTCCRIPCHIGQCCRYS